MMKLLRCKLSLALLTPLLVTLALQAENLSVDCRPEAKGKAVPEFSTIRAAVARISERAAHRALGPSTITVTGACLENVTVSSLDNLTLQASSAGASISDPSNGTLDTLAVVDSNRFALTGFTINGSVNCADHSVCRLNGNIIQNSQIGYGLRASRSQIDSQSDSISNNLGVGVIVTNQSGVLLVDDIVSNNGLHGIQAFFDGFVQLANSTRTTTISNNGGNGVLATGHGTVRLSVANITGNGIDGIRVLNGSVLRTDFAAPFVNNVTGNGAAGVNLGDLSHAFFANDGSMNITGNLGGTDVFCAGQFTATRNVASVGGTTNCVEPAPNSSKRK